MKHPTSSPSLRHTILADVQAITPLDQLEQDHLDDITQWLQSDAGIFRLVKPDIPPKHLVSYFVLVDPDTHSMLLVDHIKAQLWLPTGGHAAPNEHPANTVIREAKEELNISATFLRSNNHPLFATVTTTRGLTPGHVDVSLWYLLRASRHDFINYDKTEFTDIEWFTFDEILEQDPVIFDPHLPRFTRKLRAYL